MIDDAIWSERHRPLTIDECILPESIKTEFNKYVEQGDFPHLICAGPPGTGKTTISKALVNQLDGDYIIINASLNGNIDTLRNEIQSFASSISFSGGLKVIIFDEADYLTANSQAALRGMMQEYSKNCRFIFTCNFPNRIMEPIRESRCVEVDFKIPKEERPKLAKEFVNRACNILDQHDVPYDKKVVGAVVVKYFPDYRKVLNELQRYSTHGQIDSGMLTNMSEANFNLLIGYLKERDFTNMRKWVGENFTGDSVEIFRTLYDSANKHLEKASIPQLVITLAKYQHMEASVADKEINLTACLTELMVDCRYV